MCGVFGIFDPERPLSDSMRAWTLRARDRLRHRGPDGEDSVDLLDGHAVLGHTRLAIIDLEGGAQPLHNEDETVWVVCNGEIYNYIEVRDRLVARGHHFRTHSDCEVIVHLYEEKGTALLNELEGMFAFALLDQQRRSLLLARDRFGEKPLYWCPLGGKGVAFSSEMKALISLPGVDRRLDVAAIAQFLALRYIPAPRTHLQGVRKLMAGEALEVIGDSGIQKRRYWVPELPANGYRSAPNRAEAVREIRHRVSQSVRLRLRSDVPVAAFLSGGIDSTFIATVARELLPGRNFSTFCASFDDEELDESPYARAVAERIGSDHHEVHFNSREMVDSFEALIDHYDEPFADASMFPTFAVCRAARRHCKVMLSGDGGDECFAGYREFFRYYGLHPIRRVPGVNESAAMLRSHWGESWRGGGVLDFLSCSDWSLLYGDQRARELTSLFAPEYRQVAEEGLQELRARALHHSRLPYPRSAIESMSQGYLPEQILVKVDRASMRSALECRAPFLDSSLSQFVRSLPPEYHFERGLGKALLRHALPEWVPPQIRWRQKRGFTPPLADWLRGTLRQPMQDALGSFPDCLQPVLQPTRARQLFDEHQKGNDRSDELFRWLVLTRSCRQAEAA